MLVSLKTMWEADRVREEEVEIFNLGRSRKKNGPTSQETAMTKIVFQFRNHD